MSTTEDTREEAEDVAEEQPSRRLTFRDIANAQDVAEEDIEIPQWGGTVRVRGLTVGDIEALVPLKGTFDYSLALIARSMVDPPMTPEQAGLLRQKSDAAVELLLAEIMRVNAMGPEVEKALVERFPD